MRQLFGNYDNVTGVTSTTLDSTGAGAAAFHIASRSDPISKFQVYVNFVQGTVPTYECRIETLTGLEPSGTLVDPNAVGTFTPSAAGYIEGNFAGPFSMAVGDYYACVINYSSGTIDSGNRMGINRHGSYYSPMYATTSNNWASSNNSGQHLHADVLFDDGLFNTPLGQYREGSEWTGSNETGVKLVPPVDIDVSWVQARLRLQSDSAKVNIYAADGTTLLSTGQNKREHSYTSDGDFYIPVSPVTLSGGSTYYACVQSVAAAGVRLGWFDARNAAQIEDIWGLPNTFVNRSTPGSGAFTETATRGGQISLVGEGSGGGGGGGPAGYPRKTVRPYA